MDAAETHPLFSSGEWEGFYTYAFGPDATRHTMSCIFHFCKGIVTGQGIDDVSSFRWRGTYDTARLVCDMTKFYVGHNVHYQGNVDENGIWGIWRLEYLSGGFHLWRKQQAVEHVEETAVVEERKPQKMHPVHHHSSSPHPIGCPGGNEGLGKGLNASGRSRKRRNKSIK